MNDEHRQVSANKVSLEQRMAKRPQVLARFHSIADMLDQAVAAGCTADEAEARAIEQVRQLGRELLGGLGPGTTGRQSGTGAQPASRGHQAH